MFLEVNAMPTTLSSIKKDLEGRIGSEIMLVAQTESAKQNVKES